MTEQGVRTLAMASLALLDAIGGGHFVVSGSVDIKTIARSIALFKLAERAVFVASESQPDSDLLSAISKSFASQICSKGACHD